MDGTARRPVSAGRCAQESLSRALGQDPAQDRCGRAEPVGEHGDKVVRHAGAEGRGPQDGCAQHGLRPRLPPGRPRLVGLGRQGARVGVLDERWHLSEAEVRGEGRVDRSRVGLVDVAEPAVCGDRIEDQLGATERDIGLVAGFKRDEKVGKDFPRDVGGEVGGPLSDRAARVRASGDLPGDRQLPQVERLVRQNPLGPAKSVGADVQDGAAQDLAVLRLIVRLLPSADDRQARPAEAGERVGDGVVETSVVTGQVPGTDPVRSLGRVRAGRVEGGSGYRGASKGWVAVLLAAGGATGAARGRLDGRLPGRLDGNVGRQMAELCVRFPPLSEIDDGLARLVHGLDDLREAVRHREERVHRLPHRRIPIAGQQQADEIADGQLRVHGQPPSVGWRTVPPGWKPRAWRTSDSSLLESTAPGGLQHGCHSCGDHIGRRLHVEGHLVAAGLGGAGDGDIPPLAVAAGAAEREPSEVEAAVRAAHMHVPPVVHDQVEVLGGDWSMTSLGRPEPSCQSRSRRASAVVEKPGLAEATVTSDHLSDLGFSGKMSTLTCPATLGQSFVDLSRLPQANWRPLSESLLLSDLVPDRIAPPGGAARKGECAGPPPEPLKLLVARPVTPGAPRCDATALSSLAAAPLMTWRFSRMHRVPRAAPAVLRAAPPGPARLARGDRCCRGTGETRCAPTLGRSSRSRGPTRFGP